MAFISYRDKKIIPAPFISVQKEYVKSSGGTTIANHPDASASKRQDNIIGSFYTINITGTIVASMMGSPQLDGTLWNLGGYPDASQANPKSESDRNPPTLSSTDLDKQRFNRILKMQQSLRWLFAADGYFLEIDDGLSNEIFKCIVREVQNIEFSEAERGENWTDRCEYTITLITDRILSSGHPLCPTGEDADDELSGLKNLPKDEDGDEIYLEEATEDWSIEPQEEGSDENSPYTFIVNHNVNAKGKRVYDGSGDVTSEAWQEAEKWVKTKIMNGTTQSTTSDQETAMIRATTGLNLGTGYDAYNRIRTENVNEMDGSYSITETFLLSNDNTIETYDVGVRTSIQTGLSTLSINGSIRGLDDNVRDVDIYNKTDTPNEKYTNALAKYDSINQLSRAQTVATLIGVTLNPTAISTSVTHDKTGGSINYSSEFNNRPTTCIAGAKSEIINVQFSGGEDVFAIIPVIGRIAGPVMQNMNTIQQKKVSISVEAIMAVPVYSGGCTEVKAAICGSKPDTASLMAALQTQAISCHPAGSATSTFKESDSESWNVHNGRYTRNITYVLKTCD